MFGLFNSRNKGIVVKSRPFANDDGADIQLQLKRERNWSWELQHLRCMFYEILEWQSDAKQWVIKVKDVERNPSFVNKSLRDLLDDVCRKVDSTGYFEHQLDIKHPKRSVMVGEV